MLAPKRLETSWIGLSLERGGQIAHVIGNNRLVYGWWSRTIDQPDINWAIMPEATSKHMIKGMFCGVLADLYLVEYNRCWYCAVYNHRFHQWTFLWDRILEVEDGELQATQLSYVRVMKLILSNQLRITPNPKRVTQYERFKSYIRKSIVGETLKGY